jgi:hypothetical protein
MSAVPVMIEIKPMAAIIVNVFISIIVCF